MLGYLSLDIICSSALTHDSGTNCPNILVRLMEASAFLFYIHWTIEPFITIIRNLHFKSFKPAYSIANLGGLYYLHSYLQSKKWFKKKTKQLLNRYTHTITVNQYKVETNWKKRLWNTTRQLPDPTMAPQAGGQLFGVYLPIFNSIYFY